MPTNVTNKSGIYTDAVAYKTHKDPVTGKTVKSSLELQVQVNDPVVMANVHGADHFERVKDGIPYHSKGKLAWKEVPLQYAGEGIRGYYARELVDYHKATVSGVNTGDLAKHGYYVKLEYGAGHTDTVVWAQEFGKNFKPVIR